jgi:hypothetical protein
MPIALTAAEQNVADQEIRYRHRVAAIFRKAARLGSIRFGQAPRMVPSILSRQLLGTYLASKSRI